MILLRVSTLAVAGVCALVTLTFLWSLLLRRGWRSLVEWVGARIDCTAPIYLLADLLAACLAFSVVFFVEWSTGVIEVLSIQLHSHQLVALAAYILAVAAAEEIVFRMLVLNGLVLIFESRWQAILLGALLFGAVHASNPSASAISLLGNSLGGVLYGAAYLRHRSIWLPLGLHAGWNFFQGPVFGFLVSGLDLRSLIVHAPAAKSWFAGSAYGPEADPIGFLARSLLIVAVLYVPVHRAGALNPENRSHRSIAAAESSSQNERHVGSP